VEDILPGTSSSYPYGMTVVGDRMIFSANDGTHGQEIWQLGPDSSVSIQILGKNSPVGKQGFAAVRLTCPITEANGPCKVKLTVKTAGPVNFKGRKKKVVISRKTITVAAGATGTAKMKISKPVLELLRSSGKARKTRITAAVSDRAGNRKTVSKAYKLGKPAK